MSEEVDKIHHVSKDLDDTKGRLSKVENSVVLLNGKVDTLGDSLEVGFKDIKIAMRDLSHRPMAFSSSMISGFIGVLAIAVGAFWMVINLLYSPLKEDAGERLEDVKNLYKSSYSISNDISLINERSIENRRSFEKGLDRGDSDSLSRHLEQQRLIENQQLEINKLKEQRIIDAERYGRLDTMDKWLKDDT